MTSGRSEHIQNGGTTHPAVCLHEERWQIIKEHLSRIEEKVDLLASDHTDHVKKMFEGNGKPAIIPDLSHRVASIEAAMLPRDDVRDVVVAFKAGKAILWTVGVVAAIGFAGILFWHLFKKA